MEVWRVIWLYIYISGDGYPPFQEPLYMKIVIFKVMFHPRSHYMAFL